jgi:rfaE bifunctional protein nucleotidyltransferase chain/domain
VVSTCGGDALNGRDPMTKVLSRREAVAWRERAARPVVFTNGVFDLLHRGHVDLLTRARALGNALVVGINSDASARRLKGPGRPVRGELDRAYVLAALAAVDTVVVYDEDTPLELLLTLRPDVLVKGGDYTPATVVGRREVESWGGRVVIVPLTHGHSTTGIIERLRAGG